MATNDPVGFPNTNLTNQNTNLTTSEPVAQRRDYDDYPDQQAPKVDHLTEIETLARQSQFTSPSGAETLCQLILEHVRALRDPAAYDKAEAEKRTATEKADAKQAEITAERKATYQVPLSHRGAQGTAQPDQPPQNYAGSPTYLR